MYRAPLEVSVFILIGGFLTTSVTAVLVHSEGNAIEPASWSPSAPVLQLYKDHLKRSSLGKNRQFNFTVADDKDLASIMNELLGWKPPEYIVKNFPYYLAGYSFEGSPVWIAEGGRFDVNNLTRHGPEMVEAAEVAAEQALLRVLKSIEDAPAGGDDIQRLEGIVDLEGMNVNKFSDPAAIALALKIANRYLDVGYLVLHSATLINSNYFVDTMVNVFRPVVGQLAERIQLYGANQRKSMRRLRELLPSSSLPPWYGGDKGFKPVAAYG